MVRHDFVFLCILVSGHDCGTCTACSVPPIGYYFTDAGTYYDNCPSTPCAGCSTGFYRSGCDGTTSSGTCEGCNVTSGFYIISSGSNDDFNSCLLTECIDDCPRGEYKINCGDLSSGECTNCTGLPTNFYWTSNGNFDDACTFEHGVRTYNSVLGNVFAGSGDPSRAFGSDWSLVAIGDSNTIVAEGGAVIAGGTGNTVNGGWSTIAGGYGNAVYSKGPYSTIGNGRDNVAGALYATIAAGRMNRIYANYATIIGGYGNKASGKFGVIVGGSRNTVTGLRGVAMGYFGFVRSVNSMVWGFDETANAGCKVEKGSDSTLQVCTQSFLVNGEDFLAMLDADALGESETCALPPGDGVDDYCNSLNLPAGTECIVYLESCDGSGRATVVCEAGDSSALGSGATWSDPVCLECPADGCYGQSCDYYTVGGAGGASYLCDDLETLYGCDCASCGCATSRALSDDDSGIQADVAVEVLDTVPCNDTVVNCTTNQSSASVRHEQVANKLDLQHKIQQLKSAYHQQMQVQHKHLDTVTLLLRKVDKLKKQQQQSLTSHQTPQPDQDEPDQKTHDSPPTQGASPTPAPRPAAVKPDRDHEHDRSTGVPGPVRTALSIASSAMRPIAKEKRRRERVLSDGRRHLSTRKVDLLAQQVDVQTLRTDIQTLRTNIASYYRLPGVESDHSGVCSDPQIVYDNGDGNVYVCDGSTWVTLTNSARQ